MTGLGPDPDGATPLSDEDVEGLIPTHVATRSDLDEVEFDNIVTALAWARTRAARMVPEDLLTYRFVFELHRRMFSDVWTWAGTQRRRETNIGVDPAQIVEQVKVVVDDARYWHEVGTFPRDEIAVRLHHRLVAVHPFPNGNGRCTRLLADLYLMACREPGLTWGGTDDLGDAGTARTTYLHALRSADLHDYEPLLAFARAE